MREPPFETPELLLLNVQRETRDYLDYEGPIDGLAELASHLIGDDFSAMHYEPQVNEVASYCSRILAREDLSDLQQKTLEQNVQHQKMREAREIIDAGNSLMLGYLIERRSIERVLTSLHLWTVENREDPRLIAVLYDGGGCACRWRYRKFR